MKTKLKSMSKRTLSIILVLLMVVSTVTVGIITTTAAYIEPDNETVGASAGDEEVGVSVDEDESVAGGSWSINYFNDGSFISSSYNTDITLSYSDFSSHLNGNNLELKFTDEHGNKYGNNNLVNCGGTIIAGKSENHKVILNNAKNYTSITFKVNNCTGNQCEVTWVSGTLPTPTDWYVIGNRMGDGTWNPTGGAHMTQVAGTTEYTVEKDFSDVTSGDNYFAIGDNNGQRYNPSTNIDAVLDTHCSVSADNGNNNKSINGAAFYRLKVIFHFDSNTKEVWVTLARKSVASSVGLTVSPKNVKLGNHIRSITATATGIDSAIQNVTYTFKTGNTVIATVDHYLGTSHGGTDSCVLSGIETGDGAADFPSGETNVFTALKNTIPVEVTLSTSEQYYDNGTQTKYLDKTASTTFNIDEGSVYYTHNGADEADPDWRALDKTTVNEIADNVSTLTYNDGFTFALSGQDEFEDTFGKYEIDQEENAYCSVTEGRKTIGSGTDSFTVYTYTVKPLKGIKAGTTKLYIDVPNKKIYAKAKFEKTTGYKKTEDEKKTVRYYFAKQVDQCKDSAHGYIDGRSNKKMWVTAWSNAFSDTAASPVVKTEYVQAFPVRADGTTIASGVPDDTTTIYLKASQLVFDEEGPKTDSDLDDSYNDFYVYAADLPIWATSACLRTYSNTDVDTAKLITLNPNRIYCFFQKKGRNTVRFSGVPLDQRFWNNNVSSRGAHPNEVDEKTFTASAVKFNRTRYNKSGMNYNDYIVNKVLSTKYDGTTTKGMYFGNFWNCDNHQAGNNDGKYDTDWKNWTSTANIAMRWANVPTNSSTTNADAQKYRGSCPYYASIWDLVGMHLKKVTKTVGTETTTEYKLQNYDESQLIPMFDYDWLAENKASDNDKAANYIFRNKDFPFVASTYEGITTFSYDSQVDPNRAITNSNGGDADKENFTNTHDYEKLGSMLGYAPFNNYYSGNDNLSFANEFNIDFYLTNTGDLKGKRGDQNIQEDIQFNFSGDDDVWVFVDGVLVLDLGGDHMPSAGSINFTKKKIYYKSAAESINNLAPNFIGDSGKDDFTTKSANVKTLDLEMILNAGSLTGEKFNFKDGTTKHTLQMFYLERGDNESNCSLSFNMPQASGLNIATNVRANDVNPGLVEKALLAANKDAFRYNFSVKLANDTEWGNVQSAYSLINGRKFDTNMKSTILNNLETDPKYPAIFDAWRVFTQGSAQVKGKLASSSSTGATAATTLSDITTSYTVMKDKTYELTDKYVDTTSTDDIAGHTRTSNGDGYSEGDFNLLTGQKAIFKNQVPPNTMIKLSQSINLDEAHYNGDNNLITYSPVAHNDVYDYYRTSYDIYDNQLQYYVKKETDATSTDSIVAEDDSDNDDSFYFTNYSKDSGVISPAMTVTYYNDINVGNITIKKELNVGGTTENEFDFKVYFKDVFGYDVDGASSDYAEAPHLTYHRYYIPAAGETPQPVFDGDPELPYNEKRGISLRAGEMAVIKGVPVETKFKVVEAQTMGYDLSTIVKRAYKSDNTNVTYISHDEYDSAFNGKQIYYERIDNNTKTIMCTAGTGNMQEYSYPSISDSTLIDNHDYVEIPNGNGTEKDKYYYNMIPIRSLTNVGDEYISNSEITFTNKRDGIDVTFNYYPRLVITGKPASISNIPDSYTFSIQDLYEKDASDNYKYVTLEEGQVVNVKFEAMLQEAIKDFLTCNGGVFENVIDDYKYFYSQKAYQKYFFDGGTQKVFNPSVKAGKNEYTKANTVYHMDYISQPLTGSPTNKDKWVSYFKDKDMTEYYDVEAAGAGLPDKKAIKKINVWLYNTPRKYHVHYNTVGATADAAAFDKLENGYYVANTQSQDNFTFYYNQRFGGKALDDVTNQEQLYFLGPNEYGYPSYTGQMLNTAETVNVGGTTYKFLYWSFDRNGLSKASDQIGYYYRVATDFTMYPVYGTEAQYEEFKNKPGLSVSINGEDSYFDISGVPKRRVNVLLTPYNCPDNDPNIYSSSVIYITLSEKAKEYCMNGGTVDQDKVHELYTKFKSDLVGLISKDTSKFTGSVSPVIDTQTYVLGVTGFRHDVQGKGDISPAVLTNKNRAQFATKFSITGKKGYANKVLLVSATMLYRTKDSEDKDQYHWIVSDNAVSYDFSPISRN